MNSPRWAWAVACLMILSIAAGAMAADKEKKKDEEAEKIAKAEKLAVASAEAWLALIDQGKYADAWKESAEYLKKAVDQKQFVQDLPAARQPLGAVKSRKLKSKQYVTSLPGAPDGQYVVIQYDTSFEHKKKAVETITPMREKDGTWRVSGYYIK